MFSDQEELDRMLGVPQNMMYVQNVFASGLGFGTPSNGVRLLKDCQKFLGNKTFNRGDADWSMAWRR
jgi:hypothetical protein